MRNTKVTAVLLTILLAGCGTSGDVTQGSALHQELLCSLAPFSRIKYDK